MLTRLLEFLTDSYKMALVSLGGAGAGTITDNAQIIAASSNATADFFQYTAWTVAILAGLIAIINGTIEIVCKKRNRQDTYRFR